MLARPDNLHSRLVYWLKILLPLSALVLLSTLFLVSRDLRPEDAIPYAEADIEDRLRSPRLTAPDFAGMTADGAALSLKAKEARLGTEGSAAPGEVIELAGLLETPDGARTELSAAEARLDQDRQQMVLGGGVVVTSSSGYRVEAAGMTVALDYTALESQGSVTAQGPAFRLEAGAMRLSLADAGSKTYLLVFKQGVRMVYLPGPQGLKK